MCMRIHRVIMVLAVLAMAAAFSITANAAGDEYIKAVKAAIPYTVIISADKPLGSGFIVKGSGGYYAVTFTAVAGQNKSVTVTTNDGKQYQAELRGTSPGAGVAVFRLTDVKGEIAVATFGNSAKLEVGEKVIALGNVQDYGICVTAGIVSGTYRVQAQAPAEGGQGPDIDFIQTDAAINPGQVGGPLVNLDGDVVGMCITFTGGAMQPNPTWNAPLPQMGLDIALPIDSIEDAIKQLIRAGGVMAMARDFGFGGMQDVNADTMQRLKLANKDGVLVFSVIKDSPADKAGIQSNDVIIEFNGKPVKNADDLKALAQSVSMGTKVTVKFVGMRENKPAQGSAEIQLPEAEKGGISNEVPGESGAVVRSDCATAISDISRVEGTPAVSSAADGSVYAKPISRVSPCVIMMDNGASAILLPKNVAGNDEVRYLITAAHTFGGREKIRLTFYKGEGEVREAVQVDGDVVGTDTRNDIAVIRVAVVGAPDQIAIGKTKDADYGTEVICVGSGGLDFSVTATAGIISVKNCQPREGLAGNFWATSACVVDGGALIDKGGKLVGLCTRVENTFPRDGVSLFLPAETALAVARELIVMGKTKSGYIGLESVRDLSLEEMIKYKVSGGVAIVKIAAGGPAEKAGLKEKQIIVKFGNADVMNTANLKMLAEAAEIGRRVLITVIDTDESRKTVEVEVVVKE